MNDKQMMLTKHLLKLRLEVKDVLINNDTVLAVEAAMEDYADIMVAKVKPKTIKKESSYIPKKPKH